MIPEKKNHQDRSRYAFVAEKWNNCTMKLKKKIDKLLLHLHVLQLKKTKIKMILCMT